MITMKFKVLLLSFFGMMTALCVKSQTLPVGLLDNVEDSYRRLQLLGKDSSGKSYMIRPLFLSDKYNLALDPDSSKYSLLNFRKKIYEYPKLGLEVYALPVTLQLQYNTKAPYGMNDNSMVQSRGYETMLSAGIYARIGPLSIQLRPEYVEAQNKSYRGVEGNETDPILQQAYAPNVYNLIDRPTSFGDSPYSRVTWGQSSIRLTLDPVSLGLSNENLWWGPGVRNSLLMSNNASGFKHLTLNTTRPVDIYIGKIEAQVIAGKLEASGVGLPKNVPPQYVDLYKDKPNDWRYLSGVVVTYQPKWVPNLFLGLDRSFIVYRKDMGSSFTDYFPFLGKLEKKGNDGGSEEDKKKIDQYISFFARWVMPESKAEVYFQYGRNDHSYDFRDFSLEPEHSRAYIVGLRKLVSLNRKDEFIQVGIEVTQLEEPRVKDIRNGESWYSHYQVKDGYTNRGQVLGAGIGPGSNMQSLDVSWVKGLKKIGFSIERVVNNNDFFYRAKYPVTDVRRHWVDFAFAGKFDWIFDRFILSSNLTYIRSLNNQWQFKEDDSFFWDNPTINTNNLHLKIGLLYRW